MRRHNNKVNSIETEVSGQLPPRKIAHRLALGLGLVLGLGVIFLEGNCPRTKTVRIVIAELLP